MNTDTIGESEDEKETKKDEWSETRTERKASRQIEDKKRTM